MKGMLGLVGDLTECLGKTVQNDVKQPHIEKLILALQKSNDQDSRQIADWALRLIKKTIA